MKNKRLILYVVPLLLIITTIWSTFPPHILKPDWRIESEPMHSAIEAISALTGILMAVFLHTRKKNADNGKLLPISAGFLGMGLLDGFHAISVPGDQFVLLHSVSVLVGSFGFSLVWMPQKYVSRYKYLSYMVMAGSILFGIWTFLFRESLPAMVRNGEFTIVAIAINFLAGVLFIIGAWRFMLDFHGSSKTEDYLFFIMALLFGLAGLMFKYSALWTDRWWLWHILRLISFIVVLGFLMRNHQKMVSDLRNIISEWDLAEENVVRLNRMYSVLSGINQLIIRTHNQEKLFKEACNIAVVQGLFRMAWIGLVDANSSEVKPVAYSGFTEGYLDNICILLSDASEGGEPIGTAIRQGKHFICNDIEYDERMLLWREEAIKRGYNSYAVFPLRVGKNVLGVFNVYASESYFFDDKEVHLLDELAGDISFALESMEREKKHERADLDYKTILRTAMDGFWLVDMQGCFLYVNDSYCRLIGYSRDELLKINIQNIEALETAEETAQHIKRVIEVGWDRFETMHRCKDGSTLDIEVSANYMNLNGGRLYVFLRDITDRKRAEAALTHRLEVEKAIANISARLIGFTDFDKALSTSLADIGKLSGASRSYLFLLRDNGIIMDNTHEWCADGVAPEMQNLQNLPISVYPWWMKKLQGHEVIHITDVSGLPPEAAAEKEILEMQDIKSLLVMPVYARAELAGFIGFDNVKTTGFWREEDIILLRIASEIIGNAYQRKRAEEALQKSEARLQLQIERMPIGCILWDSDFHVISWNPAAEGIFGFKAEEVLGKHPYDLIVPRDAQQHVETVWRRLLQGDTTAHSVNENITKDGSTIICSWSNTPLKEADGSVIGVLSMLRDITESKHAETALRESEERFRLMVENVKDYAIFMLSPEGYVTSWNAGAEHIKGYHAEEIIGRHFSIFYSREDIEHGKPEQELETAESEGQFEIEGWRLRKDGSRFWANVIITALQDETGELQGFSKVTRDITERKQAEEKIFRLNRLYSVLSNINQAIVRIRDQQKLFEEACHITVEQGLFRMAWIGIVDADTSKFRSVSHSGFLDGFLDNIQLSMNDFPEYSAFNTLKGKHFIYNDIENGQEKISWRNEAIKRGYRSSAVFPLRAGAEVIGLFNVYASEPHFFDENEIHLLDELATDISFAIESIEQEKQRKMTEEALQKAHNRISVLYTIDRAASQSLNLNEILNDALDAALKVLGIEAGGIFLLEPDGETMTFLVHRGLSEKFVKNVQHIKLGEGVSGRAASYKKPVVLDVSEYPTERLAPFIVEEGLKTLASTPLISSNKVIGALNLGTRRSYAFMHEELELLTSIGLQMGMVVQNALLYEKVQQELQERRRTEDALKESEEKFRSIAERSFDTIITLNPEGRFTYVSPAGKRMSGFNSEELIGKPFQNIIQESCIPRAIQIFGEVMKGIDIENIQIGLKRNDGTLISIEGNASPVIKEGKVVGSQGIFRDITERKRAEEQIKASLEEKEVLLREIYHRVKNNMQIISSLLKLQSRHVKEEQYREMFKESQNRIMAMSLVHEKLYRSRDLAKIDFKNYISDMMKDLLLSYRINAGNITLGMDVEKISLGIDFAIPCGLIINELVSNSLKHAFPDRRKGKIKISLHLANENTIELTVSDNGVGFPENLNLKSAKSLGLHLVTILAEKQLRGEINLNRSKGTEFKIKFKEVKK